MKRQSLGSALVLAAVAVCVSGVRANAQEFKGTFKLDEQVRWGDAILPAGNYTLLINAPQHGSIATIRGEHKSIMVMANAAEEDASTKASSLLLVGDSSTPSVRALRLAEAKVTLYYPVGQRELELEARNRQDTLRIPVAIRGK
jgi:hypothetical protein